MIEDKYTQAYHCQHSLHIDRFIRQARQAAHAEQSEPEVCPEGLVVVLLLVWPAAGGRCAASFL